MSWIPDRYRRLYRRLRRSSDTDEVREEMTEHFAQLVHRYETQGLAREDAEREARRRFGDFDAYRARADSELRRRLRTEVRRERFQAWWQDLRVVARGLRRRPGFTSTVVLTLSLALTGVAITFALVDQILVRSLPYPDASSLVVLRHPVPGLEEGQEWGLSQAGYLYFQENTRTLTEVGAWTSSEMNLSGLDGAQRISAALITSSLLRVLGARPHLGRLLDDGDNAPGAPATVVLGHALWSSAFGSDPEVLGTTVRINSVERVVVGVTEPGFAHPHIPSEVWIPLRIDPTARAVNSHWMSVIGRLAPGADLEASERELAALTARLPEVHPSAYSDRFMQQYGFSFALHSLRDTLVADVRRVLWLLFTAALLVLVVAATNVAGLFLARAESKRQETAIRAALGAGRGRLTWAGISEALILVSLAVGAALIATVFVLRLLRALRLESLPEILLPSLSIQSTAAVCAVAALLGMGIGTLTLGLPRGSQTALREAGSAGASTRTKRVREFMIVGQITMALLLVTGAGLLFRSSRALNAVDPGFEVERTWLADISLPPSRYGSFGEAKRFHEALLARVEAFPGVTRAGVTNLPPLSGADGCSLIWVEDRAIPPDEQPPCVATLTVSPGYFDAFGIRVQGRAPGWADEGEVVVSRAFADRFWPEVDPLGRGVRGNGAEPPFYRVVGVAENVRADGLDRPGEEAVYFPLEPIEGAPLWSPLHFATVVVRAEGIDTDGLHRRLREELASLDPEVPLSDVRSAESVVARSTQRLTLAARLISAVAGLAILMAGVGIYGLLAYLVGNRKREIGVRMALGASRGDVVWMVLGRALLFAALGVGAGLLGWFVVSGWLEPMLFAVGPLDPWIMAAAAVGLVGITALASVGPARRAARVDPATALRAEG